MTLNLHGLEKTMTAKQHEYAESIYSHKLTITDSPAGTGKTTVAVAVAKLMHQEAAEAYENMPKHKRQGKSNKQELYYIVAPVQEKTLGFTAGNEEKVSKYLMPLKDAIIALGGKPEKEIHSEKEDRESAWIHATTYAYLRGGNISNATVIIDEAQNWPLHELKKVLTRCHDSCHVVLIGHQKQCDIDQAKSGFPTYKTAAEKAPFAKIVELTDNFRGDLAKWADEVE